MVQSKVKTVIYNLCTSKKKIALYLDLISKAVLIEKVTASSIFINTEGLKINILPLFKKGEPLPPINLNKPGSEDYHISWFLRPILFFLSTSRKSECIFNFCWPCSRVTLLLLVHVRTWLFFLVAWWQSLGVSVKKPFKHYLRKGYEYFSWLKYFEWHFQ